MLFEASFHEIIYGITLPYIDYPVELKKYLGRRIWQTTIDQILDDPENRPVFVKPVREKRFTGTILRTENDCPPMSYCHLDEPVICSEVIEFLREWRVLSGMERYWMSGRISGIGGSISTVLL